MPFYVYILKSKTKGKSYVGHSKDIDSRLIEHNSGKCISTRSGRPWKLIYQEEYPTRSEATRREMYFKTIEGRKYLKANNIL